MECLFFRMRFSLQGAEKKQRSQQNSLRLHCFLCASHCVSNLYVNAVYNISLSLRKYFFPQNTNFVYLHKTLAQFYHFIIHIHPIPYHDIHRILKLSPLSIANFIYFIIDHSFFTIFPLTFPHKSLIILSKLII